MRRLNSPAALWILSLLVTGAGCTRYQYELIDPPDLAGPISGNSDLVFTTDAVEYRLRSLESRLIIRMSNLSSEPITLAGTRSAAVDPAGQSHPLLTQTIAPGSFVDLVLPPPPRVVEQTGPGYVYGYPYGAYRYGSYARPRYPAYRDRGDRYRGGGWYSRGRYAYYDPFFYDSYPWPRTYRVYDTSDPMYWTWEGESQVRLTLVFETAGRVIEDRFVFARKRA